jgi:hypothetical protein
MKFLTLYFLIVILISIGGCKESNQECIRFQGDSDCLDMISCLNVCTERIKFDSMQPGSEILKSTSEDGKKARKKIMDGCTEEYKRVSQSNFKMKFRKDFPVN